MNRLRNRASDEGFSLVEVMVSMMLFAIIATGTAAMLVNNMRTTRSNEARVVAASIAGKEVDKVRGLPPASVAVGTTTTTPTVGGRIYTVSTTVAYQTVGGTANACAGATGPASFMRVDTTVTWPKMGGIPPVRNNTVKALPITGAQGTTGTLTVPVTDRDGKGIVGLTVNLSRISTGATVSALTSDDGCAVFASLLPATDYVASVSASGYVDPQGVAVPVSSTLGVVAGEVTKAPGFSYDRAGSLTVTVAPSSAAFPLAAGVTGTGPMGISIRGNLLTGQTKSLGLCGATLCYSGTGTTLTVNGLFPDLNSYNVWPGTCTDSKPLALPAVASPPQGGNKTVTATAGGVWLKAPNNALRYAVHATASACVQGTSGREAFSFTAGSTGVAKFSLPLGTWRIVSALANADTTGSYTTVTVTSTEPTASTVTVP